MAGFALLAVATSASEALVGEVRDGETHHESAGAAATHHDDMGLRGDHGHEDAGAPTDHGPDHRHGTSADHCTHGHSVGVTAAFSLVVVPAPVAVLPFPDVGPHTDHWIQAPTLPPRP